MPATSTVISRREMHSATATGRVRPLTGQIPEFRRYLGCWRITCADGWLRITGTHPTACLDTINLRLDIAEETAASHHAPRPREDPVRKDG